MAGTDYIIMREDDVLGVLSRPPEREPELAHPQLKETIYGKTDYLQR